MVFPKHILLQFGGPLFDHEVWSCGIRISPPSQFPFQDVTDFTEANIDEVKTAVQTFISQWAGSSAAALEFVKLNGIGEDGHYLDAEHTTERHFTGTLQTSGRTNQHPPAVALAVSHTTGAERGPAHRGRMYIPTPVYSVAAPTGLISVADAVEQANASAVFINSINNWQGPDPATGGEASVVSRVGTGSRRKITGVQVGRVLDTMRSRRNALNEDYQTNTTAVA